MEAARSVEKSGFVHHVQSRVRSAAPVGPAMGSRALWSNKGRQPDADGPPGRGTSEGLPEILRP